MFRPPPALYALGLCHAFAGDRATGMHILRELAEKYPGVADIHLALGRALALDANFQGADAEFAKASELDAKLPEAHYREASSESGRARMPKPPRISAVNSS
jgi:Flp pilus assembly protein TadD